MDTIWKTAFREAMTKQHITYSVLADRLGMSVPGLKKVFQKPDISLERFTHICRILNLDPSELIKSDLKDGQKVKKLSATADHYLAKESQAFKLFWLLTVERLELQEAIHILRLNKAQTYAILRQMDKHKLIIWQEGDRVIVPDRSPFIFERASVSAMKFANAQAHKLIDDGFNQKQSHPSCLGVRYLSMPRENLERLCVQFSEMLVELSRKYSPLGRKHRQENDLLPVQVVVCCRQGEIQIPKLEMR